MRYPKPLKSGSTIAVTAISSGVESALHLRLDKVLKDLQFKGYKIVEGECLRGNVGYVSASPEARAAEFQAFLLDPQIDAVIPPFGGEFATETLPLLDYPLLRKSQPKWIMGYSDISTITTAITANCDWATVHGTCLMEMLAEQKDPLTSKALSYLSTGEMGNFTQYASDKYQNYFPDWQKNPLITFDLTESTRWQLMAHASQPDDSSSVMQGRLFGGCMDTLVNLFDTPYVNFEQFKSRYSADGVILYLENVEMSPNNLRRALHSMSFRKVFNGINGLLLGRSTGPADTNGQLDYYQEIQHFFRNSPFPVVYDVDVSHFPPNMTLINGAIANVNVQGNKPSISQSLLP